MRPAAEALCDASCPCPLHVRRDCWRSLLGIWIICAAATSDKIRVPRAVEAALDLELRERLKNISSILLPDSFGNVLSLFHYSVADIVCFVPLTKIVYEKLKQRASTLMGNVKFNMFPLYDQWPRNETAGVFTHRCRDAIDRILTSFTLHHSTHHGWPGGTPFITVIPFFKIGYATDLTRRADDYLADGYAELYALMYLSTPEEAAVLEAGLILFFQSRTGCRNVGKGGEKPPGASARAPYFVYLAVGQLGAPTTASQAMAPRWHQGTIAPRALNKKIKTLFGKMTKSKS